MANRNDLPNFQTTNKKDGTKLWGHIGYCNKTMMGEGGKRSPKAARVKGPSREISQAQTKSV